MSKQYYSNNPYQIKSKATEAFGTAKSLEYRESTAGYHDKLRHSKDPYEELEDLVRKGVASKRVSGDRETIFGGLDFDIRFPSDLKSEERNLWIKAQSERAYQEISRSFSRMQEEEQKIYGDQYEKIETLKKFISDSNWISENKENLRSLFEILLYIKPKKIKQEEAQYHVGVVVELPAIMRGQGLDLLRKEWGRVKSGEKGKEQDNETRRILSTIILMPDKKLVAIAKDLSSRAGLLSNPIFERNGHVVYPEKEKATA